MTMTEPTGPIISTTAGAVRGVRRADGTVAFLGIPYAEPPFGAERFRAPRARKPWEGIRDATAYASTPQRRALAEITTIPEPSIPGEDILNLNVFAPADSDGALPVLVWIHGGGYVAGSPASPWYDGRAFARDGVVTVVVSYRLGFEGFGVLPGAPNNRGVLDWVAALEWVRDNIAAFGGDPTRVTIAGQSAGGGAVMTLLAMPSAHHLFQRVISASGVPADVSMESARATTARIADQLGIEPTIEGFAGVDEAELIAAQGWGLGEGADDPREMLRGMSVMDGTLPFGPVVDGSLYPSTVEQALTAAVGADKSLLVGATLEEFGSFFATNIAMFDGIDHAEALDLLGADPATARDYAAVLHELPTAVLSGRWITDVMFRRRIVEWLSLRGAAPTWLYDFTWRSGASGAAEHCLDVPFAFDVLDDPDVERVAGPGAPQSLADRVHAAYVAFVRDGDPGWERVSGDTPVAEVFDVEAREPDGYASARVLIRSARL